MSRIEVTDHVINFRPGPGGSMPTWGLSIDGTRIGTVWETERGYAGQIEGTNTQNEPRRYTCPELPYRSAVIARLEEMAERIGIA